MTRKRETAAERDERIVAEANYWCGRWSYEPALETLCQEYENYTLMQKSRREVMDAAARILNRIVRKWREK